MALTIADTNIVKVTNKIIALIDRIYNNINYKGNALFLFEEITDTKGVPFLYIKSELPQNDFTDDVLLDIIKVILDERYADKIADLTAYCAEHTTELKIYNGKYDEKYLDEHDKCVVVWSYSQILMDIPNYQEYCELINDKEGYDLYGSSAYVVDANWLLDLKWNNLVNSKL